MNSTMLSARRLMMCIAVGSLKMLGKKPLKLRRFHAKYATRKDVHHAGIRHAQSQRAKWQDHLCAKAAVALTLAIPALTLVE
jgi:hypothetical protein